MSFREKSAWISLLSIAIICGVYFGSVIHAGPHAGFHFGSLLATVIALIVVQIVLHVVIAIAAPKEAKAPRDEREKLIELKATRIAYSGLSTAIVCACLFGALDPPIVFNTNALLFVLVTAELMRTGCQIIQYRRGA
jgi:archaellum biogenesis protein FlaJ (TadC family)